MAATPTISGIAEAARAPNTKARRTKVSGIEIASEIFKSLLITRGCGESLQTNLTVELATFFHKQIEQPLLLCVI